MNLPNFIPTCALWVRKNSPLILSISAVAGVFSVSALSISATEKSIKFLQENYDYDRMTLGEKARVCWKNYIPTGVACALTSACIISSNSISTRRGAAIAGLYSAATEAFDAYQAKVVEKLGEAKESQIRDELADAELTKHPLRADNIDDPFAGTTLFYDMHTCRYFRHDPEKIRRVQNELNRDILNGSAISVNDLYFALGLKQMDDGDMYGWELRNEVPTDVKNVNDLIDIRFHAKLTETDEPCIALEWYSRPRPLF